MGQSSLQLLCRCKTSYRNSTFHRQFCIDHLKLFEIRLHICVCSSERFLLCGQINAIEKSEVCVRCPSVQSTVSPFAGEFNFAFFSRLLCGHMQVSQSCIGYDAVHCLHLTDLNSRCGHSSHHKSEGGFFRRERPCICCDKRHVPSQDGKAKLLFEAAPLECSSESKRQPLWLAKRATANSMPERHFAPHLNSSRILRCIHCLVASMASVEVLTLTLHPSSTNPVGRFKRNARQAWRRILIGIRVGSRDVSIARRVRPANATKSFLS